MFHLKNKLSWFTCILISLSLFYFRIQFPNDDTTQQPKVTTWDALGYYLYLPAQFIYHDESKLTWLEQVDSKYKLSGGEIYQVNQLKNGNFVNKYLRGVSILQLPWFFIGHISAKILDYPQDGFSLPYQYAIAFGSIIWVIFSLFLLIKLLAKFFHDKVIALALIATCLATNLIQYVAIEGGQSHAWIFPLYVIMLWFTYYWHEKPSLKLSLTIGLTFGLACICRPTEAVMLFIPLLWTSSRFENIKSKIQFLQTNYSYLLFLILGVILAVLPQLVYWKQVTGNFVYDVGSKWDFLNPHFRVLFGFEKGWFIYTPPCLLFILGLFFTKKYTFHKSILTFTLLNIYIIIAWHIWRYGGSYSTRALMQSYSVMIFAMAGFFQWISSKNKLWMTIPIIAYFIFVNLFQIEQYNKGILHYDEMNWKYYQAIYLNKHVTPLDMSLLDTDEKMNNKTRQQLKLEDEITDARKIKSNEIFYTKEFNSSEKINWLHINTKLTTEKGLWGSYLQFDLIGPNQNKTVKIRLFNALCKENNLNSYAIDIEVPTHFILQKINCSIQGNEEFEGSLNSLVIYKN